MTPTTFTTTEDQLLIEHYPTKGGQYCSEQLKRPHQQVSNHALHLGLRMTKEAKSRIVRESRLASIASREASSYRVDPTAFQTVRTPEVAYLLGFLWADGYVISDQERGEVRLRILKEDGIDLMSAFRTTGKWRSNVNDGGVDNRGVHFRPTLSIETHNRPLAAHLMSLDYGSKGHASADRVLAVIPVELHRYWFRGLFDGDGCLYLNPDGKHVKLNVASSYEQDWSYLTKLFEGWGEVHYRVHRKTKEVKGKTNSHSCFELVKRSTVLRFCEYIYEGWADDAIGLSRKYVMYLKLKKMDKHLNERRQTSSVGKYRLDRVDETMGHTTSGPICLRPRTLNGNGAHGRPL